MFHCSKEFITNLYVEILSCTLIFRQDYILRTFRDVMLSLWVSISWHFKGRVEFVTQGYTGTSRRQTLNCCLKLLGFWILSTVTYRKRNTRLQ